MTPFTKPRRRSRLAGEADDGFVLLESIVTISLITIIMSALAMFFINATASTARQRAAQSASQVATTTVENLRSLDASTLVHGRGSSTVSTQLAALLPPNPATPVTPWVKSMDPASDGTAAPTAGATATIPTTPRTVQSGTIGYTVNQYLGWCWVPASGASTDCVPKAQIPSGAAATQFLRAVVAISWSGAHCTPASCTYVTATLISADPDPTFLLNQPLPPAPVITPPGNQSSAVGDVIDLPMTVKDGTGVPPFTWDATGLPTSLSIDTAKGHIVGTPTAAGTFSVIVTVTDAFLRSVPASFSWAVVPQLLVTDPGLQASVSGKAITPLNLVATGGAGAPYTWTAKAGTLPPGLVMSSAGQITGVPTTVGSYQVTVTVTDASGSRTASGTFGWTVDYPPLAATNPGPQISTLGMATSPLQLAAAGGSGSYAWSDAGKTLPAGITMDGTGRITGTATTIGSSTVTLTARDTVTGKTQDVTFTWAIVTGPTITAPSAQATTAGATIAPLQLTSTCPNGPCSYTLNNGPAGLTISSSGVVTGSVSGPAQTYSAVTITIRDSDGATATSATFTWTVNPPALTMGTPSAQQTSVGRAASLNVSGLAGGGTTPYTYSASGLPSWLTMNAATGVISGTAPAAKSVTTGITVSVIDNRGVTTRSAAFQWIVTSLGIAIPDQATVRYYTASIDLDNYVAGGTAPYSFTVTGLPAWLTYNATSHVVSGTAPYATSTTSGITVTVTDTDGAVITGAPFSWRVIAGTTLTWSAIPTQTSRPNVAATPLNVATWATNEKPSFSAVGLPPGLSINASTGAISGTPTMPGSYRVTVSAQDSNNVWIPSAPFTWQVTDLAWTAIPNQSGPHGVVASFDVSPYRTGGLQPFTFSAGGLPGGLTIDAATGKISGAPAWPFPWTAYTVTVTVTVTDSTGMAVSAQFTWRVT